MQSYPPENFKAKQLLTFDLQRKTGGFFKTGRSYAQLKRSNKEIKVKTKKRKKWEEGYLNTIINNIKTWTC